LLDGITMLPPGAQVMVGAGVLLSRRARCSPAACGACSSSRSLLAVECDVVLARGDGPAGAGHRAYQLLAQAPGGGGTVPA